MFAHIYKPAPNAAQAGASGYDTWVLEHPRGATGSIDPLTGTSGSVDMLKKLKLNFETKELAIAYAKLNKIAYHVTQRGRHKPVGRSYGDNFAYERKFPWTH